LGRVSAVNLRCLTDYLSGTCAGLGQNCQ